ncbi:DUF4870 domain-containing protein [Aestuariicella hydrocarbonica]|uniref:DUF4870 domain-containing protein n=1 Tax=Pseudomaricurvus hydrocarbonicus TaxID=1470433 RepID=A0A9E5MPV9_9GAMM|nr:DUF4870 domain-containing protein [Aestuariicella hydrocarbonica]NHO68225.1 DUF4870 domain-containing protein [Aestuariicella hydrocarbonica]
MTDTPSVQPPNDNDSPNESPRESAVKKTGATDPDTPTPPVEISQDSKNMAVLNWVGTLFLGFIPGLVLYLVQKGDAYVQDQSKEALNWSITLLCGYGIALVLSIIAIGLLLFPILGVVHIVFCILGVIATQKGEKFRVPYALRLIK